MDSYIFIKTLRYYLSKDSALQTLLGVVTEEGEDELAAELARKQMRMEDSTLVQIEDGYKYPVITFRMDDEEALRRKVPTNTVCLSLTIHTPSKQSGALKTNNGIKDRLRLLIRDKNEEINDQAVTNGDTLKIHSADWVGAVAWDDKTLGSSRLHKIICETKFIVGD